MEPFKRLMEWLFSTGIRSASEAQKFSDVYVERQDEVMFQTSRFFFADLLMTSSYTDEDGIWHSGQVLPDRDSFRALLRKLYEVIDESYESNRVRAYPHYIAMTWDDLKQDEVFTREAELRIAHQVAEILGEYFGWERPYDIGQFESIQEKHDIAKKLGVSWRLGSYH